jgi:hypothetical protein
LLTEALALGGGGVALAAVEVYIALDEPTEAKRYVDAAYREAWADGPPYAFVHELTNIRAALTALGIPELQLLPFAARRIPSLPDEAEIRSFIVELKKEQQDALPMARKDPSARTNEKAHVKQSRKRPWWRIWSRDRRES